MEKKCSWKDDYIRGDDHVSLLLYCKGLGMLDMYCGPGDNDEHMNEGKDGGKEK